MNREFGDFQTPLDLARKVVEAVSRDGISYSRMLEPTCGRGAFFHATSELTSLRELLGLEVQVEHANAAREIAVKPDLRILLGDIFKTDLRNIFEWKTDGPLLVVGNPPWVTNSELATLSSGNRPKRINLKKLKGLDALTGESNFDIAEAIWIKLLLELLEFQPTIALLCKTSVARNILEFAASRRLPIAESWIRKIDAAVWFNASVDACLFYVRIGNIAPESFFTDVYETLDSEQPVSRMAVVAGRFVGDLKMFNNVSDIAGASPYVWRQGVKHDASSVLELHEQEDFLRNGLGEAVDVESDFVYPLLKCTDLNKGEWRKTHLLLPQRSLKEDTRSLSAIAPRFAMYLESHREYFTRRKSSIYEGQSPYSIFGIGDYSFSAYKVAVSALHKSPVFRVIGPKCGKPVQLDDTCYFLACESETHAAIFATALNSQIARQYLASMILSGSKRQVTKKILQTLDLRKLILRLKRGEVIAEVKRIVQGMEASESPTQRIENILEQMTESDEQAHFSQVWDVQRTASQ